jgi:hypothetical protein
MALLRVYGHSPREIPHTRLRSCRPREADRALCIYQKEFIMRFAVALLPTLALSLVGCATDGYGQAAVGIGYDAPYFDAGSCWNDGWAGTFDMPYCGWYDNYFYPGSGIYVYDRDRRPHVWSDGQHNYWSGRREQWHSVSTDGARAALGGVDGRGVSRPVGPDEMGRGMGGFGTGHFNSFGGHFGGSGRGGGGGRHPG